LYTHTHTHSRNLDIQQLRNWLAAASLWVGNEIIIMETGPVSPIHNATGERPASQYSIGPLWSDPAGCRRSGVLFDRRPNKIRKFAGKSLTKTRTLRSKLQTPSQRQHLRNALFRCPAPAVWNTLLKPVLSSASVAVFQSRLKHFSSPSLSLLPLLNNTLPGPSASEVTTLWLYTNLFIIIIIIFFAPSVV